MYTGVHLESDGCTARMCTVAYKRDHVDLAPVLFVEGGCFSPRAVVPVWSKRRIQKRRDWDPQGHNLCRNRKLSTWLRRGVVHSTQHHTKKNTRGKAKEWRK